MDIPARYTDEELKAFMLGEVGNLATVLELEADDFSEAVIDTLLAYGVETLDKADDVAKLRALARVFAWKVAVDKSAGWYNFRSGQDQFERKTVHEQARNRLADAQAKAAVYMPVGGPGLTVGAVAPGRSPYRATWDEWCKW